ncbi:MAG: GNAT family N-acetyltransferase [Burkholderiales bacterium]|nr:GNAT family N-acetyltransferase [Burkholderiales bacterium]
MQPSYSIKKLDNNDLGILKELRLECLKNEPSSFRTRYTDEVAQSAQYWEQVLRERIFFGLFIDKSNLAAIAFLTKDNENQWFIGGVYTKPKFRGNGLMLQLLRYMVDYFRSENLGNKIFLKVVWNNTAAVNTYNTLGFKIIKQLDHQLMGDNNYHIQYLMQLAT